MYFISNLAKRTGLSVHTLRYYEKEGLLSASGRTASGYRQYNEDDLKQAMFIAQGKQAGFSLEDIKHLISIRLDKDHHTCEEVSVITRSKLEQTKKKIAELESIKIGLERMLDICCGGQEAATECSILSLLEPNQQDIKEQ
ncbi:MAG: Zn(2+)-responsive transcriptional regulator [Gammaproteobacteria bacterium]|nr:Zn(2+)-responsive transcriptional regulator [Gammaproteobacteria bacterium]